MSELLKINVNEHTEKKSNLTYLSWAWAWAEVLKFDPQAEWEAVEYPQPDGTVAPCMYVGEGSAMVKTRVTIKGKTRVCMLPVMDHRNKAIKNPDAFAINTAIMRCMTKAISMHGLGLYIYAGEDLPEGEEAPEKPASPVAASFRSSGPMGIFEQLAPARQSVIVDAADYVAERIGADDMLAAWAEYDSYEDDERVALHGKLSAPIRAKLRKHGESLKSTTAEATA